MKESIFYPENVIIEACIESLDQALRADAHGVHQLEICSRLDLDGLSPAKDLILQIQEQCKATAKVMIRPRAGNFVYTGQEVDHMIEEIHWCRDHDISQVVLGCLTSRNEVDTNVLERLSNAAKGLDITFHKAIDITKDPLQAISKLKTFSNIGYVLSSGKEPTARAGRSLLKNMIARGNPEIQIIIAGKVRPNNIHKLHNAIGAKFYHGRGF